MEWLQRMNAWAAPIAEQINTPIWVVAGAAYGFVALVVGFLGDRARDRWMKRVEVAQDSLVVRAEAAEAAQRETRELLAEQRELLNQVLAQIGVQSSAAGVEISAESEKSIRDTVETLAASSDARKHAALEKAAGGDVLGAADDLERLAAQQRAAAKTAAAATAETFREAGALAFGTDTARAVRNYEAARDLDPDDADTWNQLGILHLRSGRLAEAEDAFKMLLNRFGTNGGYARGAALLNLGTVAQARDDLATAADFLNQAFEAYGAVDSLAGQADALNQLGLLARDSGDLDLAEKNHRLALDICKLQEFEAGQAANLANLGTIAQLRGDLDGAEGLIRQALAHYEKIGDIGGQAHQNGTLGLIAQARGDLKTAERLLRRALELGERLGDAKAQAASFGNLASVAYQRGDLDEAEALARRSLALNENFGSLVGQAACHGTLGVIARARGDLDGGDACFAQALGLFEQAGNPAGQADQLANLGGVAQERGDTGKACAFWARAHALYAAASDAKADVIAGWMRDAGCPEADAT